MSGTVRIWKKHLTFKRAERRLKKVYGHNVQKTKRLFLEIIAFFCVKKTEKNLNTSHILTGKMGNPIMRANNIRRQMLSEKNALYQQRRILFMSIEGTALNPVRLVAAALLDW